MKFKNETSQTIMLRDHTSKWTEWIKFKPGESKEVINFVDAEKNGLIEVKNDVKTTESSIGDIKVETKQIEETPSVAILDDTLEVENKPIPIPKTTKRRKTKK